MSKLLLLLLLFVWAPFADATVRGTIGNVDVIDTGDGIAFIHPDPDKGILVLFTGCQANTNDCTFRKANGTEGYRPPTGKKFVAFALTAIVDSAATAQIVLVTSSNDCGVIDTIDATVITSFIGSESNFQTILGTNGGKKTFSINGFELTNESLDFLTIRNIASARANYVMVGFETSETP